MPSTLPTRLVQTYRYGTFRAAVIIFGTLNLTLNKTIYLRERKKLKLPVIINITDNTPLAV